MNRKERQYRTISNHWLKGTVHVRVDKKKIKHLFNNQC